MIKYKRLRSGVSPLVKKYDLDVGYDLYWHPSIQENNYIQTASLLPYEAILDLIVR